MSRKNRAPQRKIYQDPKYESLTLSKFINFAEEVSQLSLTVAGKMKDIVKKSLINTLKKLEYPEIPVEIQKPKNDIEADFATNIAFKLSIGGV